MWTVLLQKHFHPRPNQAAFVVVRVAVLVQPTRAIQAQLPSQKSMMQRQVATDGGGCVIS